MRTEKDFLGSKEIGDQFYFGVQTQRAVENFQISGTVISKFGYLIEGLAQVKKAAAQANVTLNLLDKKLGEAIIKACDRIIAGEFHDQFVVDVLQGGAGTSTNMNANEVIANIALEILGHAKGDYHILHPNNHVNLCQSTNDAYPTALKIATILYIKETIASIKVLSASLKAKAKEFNHIVKMGRTQLQDAVPMTLGQEFGSYHTSISGDEALFEGLLPLLLQVNLGATAIGTGINTVARYKDESVKCLAKQMGMPFKSTADLFQGTWDTSSFVHTSSVCKHYAIKLSKIANDLRLLSAGPRCGLAEIMLPEMQPGSSIMPAKVNPVIPEAVNLVAFNVIGNDMSITMASEAAQLQLNAMEPLIAYKLFSSLMTLKEASLMFAERCIDGIIADEEVCAAMVEKAIGVVTAMVPSIGYEAASSIGKEAKATNKTVREVLESKSEFSEAQIKELLNVEAMLKPHANKL